MDAQMVILTFVILISTAVVLNVIVVSYNRQT